MIQSLKSDYTYVGILFGVQSHTITITVLAPQFLPVIRSQLHSGCHYTYNSCLLMFYIFPDKNNSVVGHSLHQYVSNPHQCMWVYKQHCVKVVVPLLFILTIGSNITLSYSTLTMTTSDCYTSHLQPVMFVQTLILEHLLHRKSRVDLIISLLEPCCWKFMFNF